MTMRKLNSTEEKILQILWEIDRGFPREILDKFVYRMPYNTFLSIIRKLEKEGFLAFNKIGRSHQYYPLLEKKDYSKSLFRNLFNNYLGSSKEQLLSFFMEEENIDPVELHELLDNFKKHNDE